MTTSYRVKVYVYVKVLEVNLESEVLVYKVNLESPSIERGSPNT